MFHYFKNKSSLKEFIIIVFIFILLTLIYLFPLLQQGLILLPLDLLIANYSPWYSPGTILLKNPYMQDSIVQLYPWRHLVFDSFIQNIIPFWNPYQHMGMPFMAGFKPMVFYPFNILFIFGEVPAWHGLLLSQILLGLIFTYLFVRKCNISIGASILSAISFSLSSLLIGLLVFGSDGHAIIWWPFFLYSAKQNIDTKKGRYLFLLALAIALSVLAGHLQYTTYGLIMLSGFILFYSFTKKEKKDLYISFYKHSFRNRSERSSTITGNGTF